MQKDILSKGIKQEKERVQTWSRSILSAPELCTRQQRGFCISREGHRFANGASPFHILAEQRAVKSTEQGEWEEGNKDPDGAGRGSVF